MQSKKARTAASALLFAASLAACEQDGGDKVPRGKYLVTVISCGDCHTPGALMGKPDMTRNLAGSDIGFFVPESGYFYGPNLTPDKATGLGKWSEDEIVTAIRTGKRPDGRMLSPVMPWKSFASLTDDDARAIATYLKSLAPISNKVPGPFGAHETPTSFYMPVLAPSPPAASAPTVNDAPPVTPDAAIPPAPTPH
jgi:mono/diheme cytochrome c family protein